MRNGYSVLAWLLAGAVLGAGLVSVAWAADTNAAADAVGAGPTERFLGEADSPADDFVDAGSPETGPPRRGSVETAALTAGETGSEAPSLPHVLRPADVERYRSIFLLQEEGRWREVDPLITALQDRSLMGHVLAQRYLHPTKYRSHYNELKDWLAAYADHPDAPRLYKMALQRQPRGASAPAAPTVRRLVAPGDSSSTSAFDSRRAGLTAGEREKAARLKQRLQWYLRKGWTKAAKELLRDGDARRLLGAVEYDGAAARLGAGYFADGHDRWALEWADGAARRSGQALPEAHWTAGLAAWRLNDLAKAARHFETVATTDTASPWLVAAAAFWAARAELRAGHPQEVNRLLGMAAEYPRTFYGILARRVLGLPMSFTWSTPELEAEALDTLAESPGGRRALALVQVGEDRRAEGELTALAVGADEDLAMGVLVLASRAQMPALAMRLGNYLFPDGGFDGASYPIPRWTPKDGFRVDRALIYALVRQESGFNPAAKSGAGASGLMQLMPGTAGFVAGDRHYRGAKRQSLFQPEINLELGQKYVEMLLKDPQVNGDLFQLAAAWNGGPGNLNKWWRRTNHNNDPLLFIESIPLRETRIFIERVLTNLWTYRHRFGQPAPSLDAIAAGEWPTYVALDGVASMVASRDQDRK